MINVNGKKIPVYDLDTKTSLTQRIAVYLETLSPYIIGLPEDFLKQKKIQVVDLLDLIKKNAETTDFNEFKTELKAKNIILPENLDFKKHSKANPSILKLWLAYNTEIEKIVEYNPIILEKIGQDLTDEEYFNNSAEFIKFWQTERQAITKDIADKITQQKKDNAKDSELSVLFQDKEERAHTDIIIERVDLILTLDLISITLLEIFNNISLSENVPFAVCQNYYKILKSFIPPEEWNVKEETDQIILKINEKSSVLKDRYKDYTDIKINIDGDILNQNITATMRIINEKGHLKQDEFITRFLNCFVEKVEYKNLAYNEVIGTFYFPNTRLLSYVFSDLVMNNSLFSGWLSIDESNKATKKKSDYSEPWLYLHFNHIMTGHVTASITQKIIDRTEPIYRDDIFSDQEIFAHGEPLVRVRVKGKEMKSLQYFIEIFSKLITIYEESKDDIIEIYQKFLPDFGTVVEPELKELKTFNEAPEIFVSKFSRVCSKEHQPTIVSDDDAKKLRKEDKQIMVFPREKPHSGIVYPSDGKNTRNYACLNEDFPYPGLQINKLKNSDEYPYLPCCFKTDQTTKIGGNYRNYYFGEDIGKRHKKQQDLITTDKMVDENKFATLSEDLEKIFNIVDMDKNYQYLRIGVIRGKDSFINCVLAAVNENYFNMNIEEKINFISETKQKLSEGNIVSLARQCLYDRTSEQIASDILQAENYFEPRHYIQLLEGYFNCNIFLFNREKMILPRFSQGYYRFERQVPCVFIYENWGGEFDNAKFPQCEIIVRWNRAREEVPQYSYDSDSKIVRNVNTIFHLINKTIVLNKPISDIVFPMKINNLEIESQIIDSYGKTRCLIGNYKGNPVSILTEPMPPLILPETKQDIIKVNIRIAKELLENLSANRDETEKYIVQIIDKQTGKVSQMNGRNGNVIITIPVDTTDPLENFPYTNLGEYIQPTESKLTQFNQNKKMSRYITEYMFWTFSNYLQKEKIVDISDDVLKKYAKQTFVVIPDHRYIKLGKNFSLQDSDIINKGKIIVVSNEMIKRLMYCLKLYIIRDLKNLISYYKRYSISQYYVDITDFDYRENEIILHGDDSIDKWIQENNFNFILHSELVLGTKNPYFFKNNNVDPDKVFIAQNSTDIDTAMTLCSDWVKNKFNISVDVKGRKNKHEYYLYVYQNQDEIELVKVIGEKSSYRFRILGYKIDNTPFFTSLMELK